MLRALVTAGGTREPIDDVRFITNTSRGRFPGSIANALQARHITTTLLATSALIHSRFEIHPEIEVVRFDSFLDLDQAITDHLSLFGPPDFLFMAAAVSDFSPIPQPGKISSASSDHLVLKLHRNPKILSSLRQRCGARTFIAGFKLLSNAPTHRLIAAAQRQNQRDSLDLTVANDLAHLKSGLEHPILMVTPEGGAIPIRGPRSIVAERIVDLVLARHNPVEHSPPLTSENTNVLSTPSFLLATDPATTTVSARCTPEPPQPPTHAYLYQNMPDLQQLLHTHLPISLADISTEAPLPPASTFGQARTLHASVARLRYRAGRGGSFLVRLAHEHGFVLGLTGSPTLSSLDADWKDACAAFDREVDADPDWLRFPIFASSRLIGVCAQAPDRSWLSPFVSPKHRGRGLGDRILREVLEPSPLLVALPANSSHLSFFTQRAFRPTVGKEQSLVLLESPLQRDDLWAAASVCLYEPNQRMVLLGRRKTGDWPDHYSLPGGKIEPGESALEAACRELEEETGVRANPAAVLREQTVYVSFGQGQAYAVTNFVILATHAEAPCETDELEPEWVELTAARALRPMASGTRRILATLE